MIDLLLVHPYHPKAMYYMTLPSLKQYLESKGFSVVTMEMINDNHDVLDAIKKHNPRFVGISLPFTLFGPSGQELIKIIKQECDIPIVVGGAHATICPDEFKEADYICHRAGEQYLLNLLSGVDPVPGCDMDDLPWIYIKEGDVYPDGHVHLRYLSARGCPFNCNFCSIKYLADGRVSFRSVPKVLDDLKKFVDAGMTHMIFCDECFTINRKRTKEMCNGIIESGLDFKWFCVTRANLLSYDLALLMKKAGCWGVGFGIESANPILMERIGKKITLDEMCQGIKSAHKAGLQVYGGFIIGFPEDTLESINMSLRFAIDSGLDFAGFGPLFPFPGTRVRDEAIQHGGYMCDDWSEYHYGSITYIPKSMEGVNLLHTVWHCHGRFMISSLRRFWLSAIKYARQRGWRPKAEFARRIFYGVMGWKIWKGV